jgi:hypothetical protein
LATDCTRPPLLFVDVVESSSSPSAGHLLTSRAANALPESFVDSVKTELISDRVWRLRTQLEISVVAYVGRFNTARPHSALEYATPAEHEQRHATTLATKSERPLARPRGAGTLNDPEV